MHCSIQTPVGILIRLSAICIVILAVHLPSGCSDDAGSAPTSDIRETGARLIKDDSGTVTGVVMLSARTTDSDLSLLSEFPQLESLRIQECRSIDGSGLDVVKELTALSEIQLVLTPVTDEGLMHLREASSLRNILFLNIDATDTGLTFLSGCPDVERLTLEKLATTDAGLGQLAGLPQLEFLSLQGCAGITGSGFTSLTALPKLTQINLMGTDVIPEHADNLRFLPGSVREVQLDSKYVSDDVLRLLGEMSSLERLRLFDAPVTGGGLVHLAQLRNLKILELSACSELTSEGLTSFAGHPALTRLDLSGCAQIDDTCVPTLGTITTLERVNLADTGFTGEGAAELKELLPECTIEYGNSPNTEQL